MSAGSEDDKKETDWDALNKAVTRALKEWERERIEAGRGIQQQGVLAFGALGAIAFAGLVLIVQTPKPSPFQPDFDTLLVLLGFACVLSAFSTLASIFGAAGMAQPYSPLAYFAYMTGLASFGCFILAVIVVIIDIDSGIGTDIAIVTLALMVVFVIVLHLTPFGKRVEEVLQDALSSYEEGERSH